MPEPKYRQIADDLRRKIESSELTHGAQLPTELELREQYGKPEKPVSRNTVRDAIKVLAIRGLVETRPGHGTFVVDKIKPFVTVLDIAQGFGVEEGSPDYDSQVEAESRKPSAGQPRIEIQQASGVVAEQLRLDEGAYVVIRHQRRYIDGRAWSLQTTFYPMSYVDRGAVDLLKPVDMPSGAVAYLKERLGLEQVGWQDKITVRAPDATEADFFGLAEDGRVAVFENHRTSYEQSGRPLRLTITAFPADRNQFVVTIGEVPPEAKTKPGAGAGAPGTPGGP